MLCLRLGLPPVGLLDSQRSEAAVHWMTLRTPRHCHLSATPLPLAASRWAAGLAASAGTRLQPVRCCCCQVTSALSCWQASHSRPRQHFRRWQGSLLSCCCRQFRTTPAPCQPLSQDISVLVPKLNLCMLATGLYISARLGNEGSPESNARHGRAAAC